LVLDRLLARADTQIERNPLLKLLAIWKMASFCWESGPSILTVFRFPYREAADGPTTCPKGLPLSSPRPKSHWLQTDSIVTAGCASPAAL